MTSPLRVFVGFDNAETVAYHVLCNSIIKRATIPVTISPVSSHTYEKFYYRNRDALQSNDFSFTRWLVPYLSNYEGISVYMDCDMLMMDDIYNLIREVRKINEIHYDWAVACVKHEHHPKSTTKYLDRPQTAYEKKNWSSFMVMNNTHCRVLSPTYVQEATGLNLHQFKWLDSENRIAALPSRWNHLVDYDQKLDLSEISVLHYTEGGPWFDHYKDCGYANIWRSEYHSSVYSEPYPAKKYPESKRQSES
jgi:hypothetical protein